MIFEILRISDFVTIAKPKDNMLTVSNNQRAKFKEIFFQKVGVVATTLLKGFSIKQKKKFLTKTSKYDIVKSFSSIIIFIFRYVR